MTAKELQTIAAKDVASLESILNITKEEVAVELPIAPPKPANSTPVTLTNNERIPSNWVILSTGEDTIEARCGGIMFNGTIDAFNQMLRSGVR